ncbi:MULTISPECIES: DNA polymerase III subunit beta [unclassified Thioalkalivibrio]|uniref:DNA polymerase III subunit beta n=1 Tax=unclassified Thioalkalivibrio TaxID=2621013 RepID=UPI000374F13F|nr:MULTISPECIES: DNA polymerase III subunit beta [unclassified Thioalkalivibrio]
MELTFQREAMTDALQRIVGAAEKRLTMPILGNVRLRSDERGGIRMDTTDLELAWQGEAAGSIPGECDVTVSVRKLLDVVKAAPEDCEIRATIDGERMSVGFAGSRFSLATLPGGDFPDWEGKSPEWSLDIPQNRLRRLLEATMFSMAQQDVRYYLQGLLLVASGHSLRAVATDGHRLALAEAELDQAIDGRVEKIVPRKTVAELRRNLSDDEVPVRVGFSDDQVLFDLGSAVLRSKVIEGRFPDYERVIPTDLPATLTVERERLKQALSRVSIVASDKYRGVRMTLGDQGCQVMTHNADREEAQESVEAEYQGPAMEIGFNLGYLVDVLNAIETDRVRIGLRDGNSSILVQAEPPGGARYVVMPMRL